MNTVLHKFKAFGVTRGVPVVVMSIFVAFFFVVLAGGFVSLYLFATALRGAAAENL